MGRAELGGDVCPQDHCSPLLQLGLESPLQALVSKGVVPGGDRTFRRWVLVGGSEVIGGVLLRGPWDPGSFLSLSSLPGGHEGRSSATCSAKSHSPATAPRQEAMARNRAKVKFSSLSVDGPRGLSQWRSCRTLSLPAPPTVPLSFTPPPIFMVYPFPLLWCWGPNPRPPTRKAMAVPLSHFPVPVHLSYFLNTN